MNDIVQKNIDVEENTFIFLLHEESIFDEVLFQQYIKNVSSLNAENTEKEKIISTIKINDYIIRSVVYHFLPNDLFFMKVFPSGMSNYIEQIRIENERLLSSI